MNDGGCVRLSVHSPTNSVDFLDSFFSCDGKIGLVYSDMPLTRLAMYGITLVTTQGHTTWALDGANSFDAYFVARLARNWNYAPEFILGQIKLSRAFTCYQMSELITQRLYKALSSPKDTVIFCLGLLETFYDEDVNMVDAVRMVKAIVATFSNLAQQGYTIIITTRGPRAEQKERRVLLNLLIESAQRVECIQIPNTDRSTLVQQPLLMAG